MSAAHKAAVVAGGCFGAILSTAAHKKVKVSAFYLQIRTCGNTVAFRLSRKPEEYTLGEILRLTEGSLSPVSCLECGAAPCDKAADCRTLPVWTELDWRINEYLNSVTVADLLQSNPNASSVS